MPLSRWLDLKVTQRCNNHARKCTYCAVPTSPPTAPELMAMETIHRTLLDARALGFDTFWLLGGEPTCRDDAEHLVDPLASDPRVALTVVTNGKTPRWPLYDALFATAARRAMVQGVLVGRSLGFISGCLGF